MPKNVIFESFKYRFLCAAQTIGEKILGDRMPPWNDFIDHLEFTTQGGIVNIIWTSGTPGKASRALNEAHFYVHGDIADNMEIQGLAGSDTISDPISFGNNAYFMNIAKQVAQSAGYQVLDVPLGAMHKRRDQERGFHDAWANSENIDSIDVRMVNRACTSPEMRYITQRLGDLRGKRLLDVGCGLGEASVYFALGGAEVTSSDLSPGMLDATCRLAKANGVEVTPHLSAAEDLRLLPDELFDIIYAGNLLHHVDIEQTLIRLKQHLSPAGLLITWDPVAYNPIINIYRAIAIQSRTPNEHPLRWRDIQLFHRHFHNVETRFFWLTTLLIFVIMALLQRRDPNKERFWKIVVQEGEKWRWLYMPLEAIDKIILKLFPPLRLLCWNVVVCADLQKRT